AAPAPDTTGTVAPAGRPSRLPPTGIPAPPDRGWYATAVAAGRETPGHGAHRTTRPSPPTHRTAGECPSAGRRRWYSPAAGSSPSVCAAPCRRSWAGHIAAPDPDCSPADVAPSGAGSTHPPATPVPACAGTAAASAPATGCPTARLARQSTDGCPHDGSAPAPAGPAPRHRAWLPHGAPGARRFR